MSPRACLKVIGDARFAGRGQIVTRKPKGEGAPETEGQGATSWSSDDLRVKYRAEREREEAYQAFRLEEQVAEALDKDYGQVVMPSRFRRCLRASQHVGRDTAPLMYIGPILGSTSLECTSSLFVLPLCFPACCFLLKIIPFPAIDTSAEFQEVYLSILDPLQVCTLGGCI